MPEEFVFETPEGQEIPMQEQPQEEEIKEEEEVQEETREEEKEDTESTDQEDQDEPKEDDQQEEKPQSQNDIARNLANLRQKATQAERERDELLNYVRQMQQYQQPQVQQQSTQPAPQEEITYSDDDLVEGKHLKRERERYNKEIESLRKDMQQYKQQTAQAALEQSLKSQYPDIEQVLTVDNVNAFRELKPRLAQSLAYNPDPYAQAVETYEQIKALGLSAQPQYTQEKKKIQKNTTKPRSVASLSPQQGESPLSRANAFADGLTPERKAELYQDMIRKARGG